MIMGVALEPVQRAVYKTLLSEARRACASRQDAAEDMIVFAEEGQRSCLALECGDLVAADALNADESLSEQEKDLALRCISAMLSARSLDASFRAVLKLLGNYYRADRVYTLMLVENQDAVVMTFEWTANGKHSIKHTVSGMRLDRFPALRLYRFQKGKRRLLAGWNDTCYYPSLTDMQSSLAITNSSSSLFTLKVMSVVSLLIPFVAAYIWYAWRALTRPISEREVEEAEHKY